MSGTASFDRREFLKVAGTVGILSGTAETAVAQQSDGRPNELLVGVAPSANARQTAQRALPSEARIVGENDTLGYVRAELPERDSPSAAASVASTVASRRGVEYAEPNAIYEALVVPNDPRFGDQYAPEMVNAPAAWDTTFGDGEVTIAVVDQGIKDDHPDLEATVASDRGRDFVDDDDDPSPDSLAEEQHGTHVAGIAAAGTDNDTGVAGISNATLLSVRVLDETESGSTADIADGIQWAADNGADIINLSLGGGGFTETLQKAVSYANEEGVLLVAAAGNDSGSVNYPAAYDECLAVSALDPDGSLASYSSRGPEIELAAPGTNLLSTWTNDGYETLSGTSMAAPVVSGIAVLVLSRQDLTNTQIQTRLTDSAIDAGLSDEKQGSGRVDATAAMGSRHSELTIQGTGSRADYTFSASGSVEGLVVNPSDTVRDSSAAGFVHAGIDRYAFSGELESFDLDGEASVTVDGEPANVGQRPDHVLTIQGTGSRADYTFSVSGSVEGLVVNSSDTIRDSSAEGFVHAGVDRYAFSGELESFDLDGEASVTVDGEPARVGQRPDHVLTIQGTGRQADYTLSVSESVQSLVVNDSDTVRDSSAEGVVHAGIDRYAFSGEVELFDLDGEANVTVDGKSIDPSAYSDSTLSKFTIKGSGSRADYTFTVSGNVESLVVNDSDTVREDGAEGVVHAGVDRYEFSGNLLSFTLVDGARVELDRSAKSISIEGNGSRVDYAFSVSGSIEGLVVNPSDTVRDGGAEGRVHAGSDRYGYSGELRSLTFDGTTVSVTSRDSNSNKSPTIGIHNGLSDANFDTINRMEEWQNTDYAVQNLFVPWNPDEGHMNWLFDEILPQIWNNGRTPLITWEPYTPGARAASVDTQSLVERNEYSAYLESLADTTPDDIEVHIKDGEYDGYIDRWANRLRNGLAGSGDRQAYLRLAHEMNSDWYPWSPTVGNSSPGSYVGMWRHVHNRLDRQGLGGDDLQWMWCVNAEDVGSYRAEQLYPGNRYVDWLGLDGYQWGRSQSWSSWQSPDSIYGEMLDRLAGLGDKPVCVAEFASSSNVSGGHNPQRKDAWIRDALAYFENQGIDMWCWFNEDKETDWAVFNGVRGTETVAHNGTQVNAYSAYRKAVDAYGSATSTTATKSASFGQATSDD